MPFDITHARLVLGHPDDVPNLSEVHEIRKALHDAIHVIERIIPVNSFAGFLGALAGTRISNTDVTLTITPEVAQKVIAQLQALAKLRQAGIAIE